MGVADRQLVGGVDGFGRPKMNLLTPKSTYGVFTPVGSWGILPVESESTAPQIAHLLAGDVHAGALRPGDMFPSERDLCERFGVGRSIVRDAMTILQGMGLTDHAKGKRPRVAAPTLSRVMIAVSEAGQFFFKDNEGRAHLQQARLFLETSMVRYAVEHATNAQIAKMVSAVEECDANLDDLAEFRHADVRFHRALAAVPGNPIFVALHETFVERLMKGQPIRDDFAAHNATSNAGHKEIMNALLAKDADLAVQALTLHLTRNYESNFHLTLKSQMAEIS
jgi:DNA-binding FadR family transcriptional regulator